MNEAAMPKRPLWDTQWSNIVNANNCWRDYSKEDAVHEAVKMTEDAIAKNQAKASEWQPIETAPRDKTTVVLLRCNDDGSVTYGHGFYMPLDGWFGWTQCAYKQPTHWMPLPAAPGGER